MTDIWKKCLITGKPFVVSEWEQGFLEKMDVPHPTLCPAERHRRRLAHRNERTIYKDVCDKTGKSIISMYSPDKRLTVYGQDAWWGDFWDQYEFGRDFDFSRPFFDQFFELRCKVPRLSLMNKNAENSEYCNITNSNKNCYLVFGGDFCEDCMYSIFSMHSKDTYDVYWVNKSELCYDCVDCNGCYGLRYSQYADYCRDGDFLFECRSCEYCSFCVGLRNKRYHIFNKPYSKEEYVRKMASYRLDTWSGVLKMKEEFRKFRLGFPHRYAHILQSEHVTGDGLVHCKNCDNCFDIEGPAEDFKDVFLGGFDSRDVVSSDHFGFKSDYFYEMVGSIEGYRCAFCTFSWGSQNAYYCDLVMYSHDLFGCSAMKKAEYCILNKRYSKSEYFEMRKKIIEHMKTTGEWGEFFPVSQSLWGYNETVAQDYFPMSRDEALGSGLSWKDEESRSAGAGPEIADSILDVSDAILDETLLCHRTGRSYKIIPRELAFYRKRGIPIPRFAPETRNRMRISMRRPIETWKRDCFLCGKVLESSYALNCEEKVYCEACYLKEIYS